MRQSGNTGVKGVLADYADAKERLRQRTEIETMQKVAAIVKQAITALSIRERDELREVPLPLFFGFTSIAGLLIVASRRSAWRRSAGRQKRRKTKTSFSKN